MHAGHRRGERREIAELVGRDVAPLIDRSLPPMSGRVGVALRLVALRLDLHRVELRGRLREPRVGDEDILIAGSLDLELLCRESERRDVDHVVAFVAREDDAEAAGLVGARVARDVAVERRHRDGGALDRQAVRSGDAAANDVALRVSAIVGARWPRQMAAARNAMRRRLTVKPEVWEDSDTLEDAVQPGC